MTDARPEAAPPTDPITSAKSSRRAFRGHVTRTINKATRQIESDFRDTDLRELLLRKKEVLAAIEDQNKAQELVLTTMEAQDCDEEQMKAEEDSGLDYENKLTPDLKRIDYAITISKLYHDYTEIIGNAKAWIEHSDPTNQMARDHGTDLASKLNRMSGQLNRHQTYDYFKAALTETSRTLTTLRSMIYKTTVSSLPPTASASSTSSSAASPVRSGIAHYTLQPPKFSGKIRDFPVFKERFMQVIKKVEDVYTDGDKTNLLAEAMLLSEAKKLVEGSSYRGFTETFQQLEDKYGSHTQLYMELVKDLINIKSIDFTQEGISELLHKGKILKEMEKIGGRDIDTLITAIATMGFDYEMRKEWLTITRTLKKLPTWKDLETHFSPLLHKIEPRRTSTSAHQQQYQHQQQHQHQQYKKHGKQHFKNNNSSNGDNNAPSDKLCPICKNKPQHSLFKCNTFMEASVSQRLQLVKQNKLCQNCLHHSHLVRDCASDNRCKTCNGKHHSMLHDESKVRKDGDSGTALLTKAARGGGSLSTAVVIAHHEGRKMPIRLSLDTSSTHSVITAHVADYLRLPRQHAELVMEGVSSSTRVNQTARLSLKSRHQADISIDVEVAIAPSLTSTKPPADKSFVQQHPLLQDLKLADSEFGGELDMIIGTYDLPLVMDSAGEVKCCVEDRIMATSTVFGWVVTSPTAPDTPSSSAHITANSRGTVLKIEITEDVVLDQALQRLYETEKVPDITATKFSPDEQSAIDQFNCGIRQSSTTGLYTAPLPKVEKPPALGKSRQQALSRAIANERTMKRRGKLAEFKDEMRSYINLGHAHFVPSSVVDKTPHFYLPVHGVLKDSSTTTSVRPVFDGSARSSNGVAINDHYLSGPSLYPPISGLLIQFRMGRIAMVADISKMFRNIELLPSDQDLHRFFVRDSEGTMRDARMSRLTFGIRCSPFVATSVLLHHADKHKQHFPEASRMIRSNFYVDDFVASVDTVDHAIRIRQTLCQLLSFAGMKLRKWRSNSKALLDTIPDDLIELKDTEDKTSDLSLTTLGLHWDSRLDSLFITVPNIPAIKNGKITKRHIASVVGMVYDLLGLLSPFTITAKLLLRQLWQLKTSWDDQIPSSKLQVWQDWTAQLPKLSKHPISRCVLPPQDTGRTVVATELHAFADASSTAYATSVYIRHVLDDGTISTALLMSKAKVCPLKQRTIPQLELEAAKLAAQLLLHVASSLKVDSINWYAWSDSRIVLAWLKKMPCALHTYVANRVGYIQERLPQTLWRYVATNQNPADLPTRGLDADQLMSNKLWWNGPQWLRLPVQQWPPQPSLDPTTMTSLPCVKVTTLLNSIDTATPTQPMIWNFYEKFSCYNMATRVLAWVMKFCQLCRKSTDTTTDGLTQSDIQKAATFMIRMQQKEAFPELFLQGSRHKQLPRNHALAGVKVHHTSNDHALHITGRVRDPETNQPRKLTPLHHKSKLTKLFLRTLHIRHGHPGTSGMLAILSQEYFIPGAKAQLKRIARECVLCRRAAGKPLQQQMGLLPIYRTSPGETAFSHTGIDFAGPLTIKEGSTRRPQKIKSYICLFICLKTKATHAEVCRTLTTEEFLCKYRKFCNLRGTPSNVYSDNGSNFIGAANEIQEVQNMLQKAKDNLIKMASTQGTTWHFIPARTPHFGGIWESGIKAMKVQLRKMIGPHPLRQDELEVLLAEVTAILNCRPLCPTSATEQEQDLVITPGHFLTGRLLKVPPTGKPSKAKISTLKRWKLVNRLSQDLWEAWWSCYVPSLQSRSKWRSSKDCLKEGDLVYVQDKTLCNDLRWPIARVTKVHPGSDGLIRAVNVKMPGGKILSRGIDNLILLHFDQPEEGGVCLDQPDIAHSTDPNNSI